MADQSFDRTILNVREKPFSSDINQAESQADRGLRWMARVMGSYRPATGLASAGSVPGSAFVGDGLQVNAENPATMNVVLGAGLGFQDDPASVPADIGGIIGLSDLERWKPLPLTAAKTLPIPAADPGNPRIDIVEVQYLRAVGNPQSREILDIGTGIFTSGLVDKTLGFSLDSVVPSINGASAINYKTGVAAGVPVAPAFTAGYIKLAEIVFEAAAVSVSALKVKDKRLVYAPNGVHKVGVTCTVNPTTGLFVGTPSVNAPPGFLAHLSTSLNYNGMGVFAVSCVVYPAGSLDAGGRAAIAAGVADGFWANASQAAGPVVANVEAAGSGGSVGGPVTGTDFWPNPSPIFPAGASIAAAAIAPQRWDVGTQLFTQAALPNPTYLSWDFTIPFQ